MFFSRSRSRSLIFYHPPIVSHPEFGQVHYPRRLLWCLSTRLRLSLTTLLGRLLNIAATIICQWRLDFKWVDEVRDVPGSIAEYAIAA
jgi:hypothetical protein